MKQRVAFLDRDGTINVDLGHVHRFQDWRWTDRAVDAIRLLNNLGLFVAVVTNQSAIAAGLYTAAEVNTLHEQIQRELEGRSARIDCFAICPHAELAGCGCRKPKTGLAETVERAIGAPIDFESSWVFGDKLSDVEFGRALGARTALVRSSYWTPPMLSRSPTVIGDSLFELVGRIGDSAERSDALQG